MVTRQRRGNARFNTDNLMGLPCSSHRMNLSLADAAKVTASSLAPMPTPQYSSSFHRSWISSKPLPQRSCSSRVGMRKDTGSKPTLHPRRFRVWWSQSITSGIHSEALGRLGGRSAVVVSTRMPAEEMLKAVQRPNTSRGTMYEWLTNTLRALSKRDVSHPSDTNMLW